MHAIGAGPDPVLLKKVTGPQLEPTVATLLDDGRYAKNALRIGERIGAEDGVGAAIRVIEDDLA